MNLIDLLEQRRDEILEEATSAPARPRLNHDDASGPGVNEARLRTLYDVVLHAVRRRDLVPMLEYAEALAFDRFATGFDLQETQAAFDVLEEAIWRHLTLTLQPEAYPEAFGLIGTVFGAGKEALAGHYVSLARLSRTPPLDRSAPGEKGTPLVMS